MSIVVLTVSIIDSLHNPHPTHKYNFSFSLFVRLGLRRWKLPETSHAGNTGKHLLIIYLLVGRLLGLTSFPLADSEGGRLSENPLDSESVIIK